MTTVLNPQKSLSVNPLKMSQPLGAALAFLGLKGMMPLFHGAQGCTAFAKVVLVRHFRESIPLSTTAMTEVSTILGGEDHVEQAILTIVEKYKPQVIGLLTTGLTETRGDDMGRILKIIREKHPELNSLPIISVSTPDYKGSLQDGYTAAIESIVATDYGPFASDEPPTVSMKPQVTVLCSSHLSPGDVEELKSIVEAFDLTPVMIPDLSRSLDGHLEDNPHTVTTGGTTITQLKQLNRSCLTLAIGESMRKSAQILEGRFGTKYEVFPRLAGLDAVDAFLWRLSQILTSRCDHHFPLVPNIPTNLQRQRRQLQDVILDTHFYFGGKKVCLALEPDLLYQTAWLLTEMGAKVQGAVTTTKSPILESLPIDNVTIGDLADLEDLAAGSDLIITNSHGTALSKRLQAPLYRMGYPIYDKLGLGQRCLVGYRGTMQFLFDVGNILMEEEAKHSPATLH
ncbi:nitrogenase iron-molybdenum cofactor biosynthesis protein NifN [Crocosphaera sp. XPORK-15E]|uniref:nitrogenase iron-molybdenum cofactor biosynthesis protein NifN n=1 Tax=Crocosphaera sp. XPORK-15E TaxID=3110247 RepID=UPI002B20E0F6|nr:nitrogenase iron-molybdenum cofactor biosynthesis protein NifN [Crocosphaera sp. XPORK-15E]MEA5533390.1 nitrogenase iron-molybdenum cofactor biosynthesis protein NifN [Crocosphaera sp. XPORK-15E]